MSSNVKIIAITPNTGIATVVGLLPQIALTIPSGSLSTRNGMNS
jgi:hypothetical protein